MNRELIMSRWDAWRKYIAEGGKASWPRDEFERLLDQWEEESRVTVAYVRELQNIFDSITCLCAEGPEVTGRMELIGMIEREAMRGYKAFRKKGAG